ncbi:MAG TPA: oxygenase MpaB family protein [Streptosporangiaceae bacterium]|jgi:uncharacterized protein (DUF2236 family)
MSLSEDVAAGAFARSEAVEPLGPGSLIWRYLGDTRYALIGRMATTLQVMHPAIGAAVADPQLSVFFQEPIARVVRSVPLILGVVYDGPGAHATAGNLLAMHIQVKGIDGHGRRYHALDPEIFYWAHATFVYALQEMIERLAGPLPAAEREQLYDECCRWYRMYGLSDRPMPTSLADFRAYVEHVCEQELEATPAALRGKQMFGDPATIPQEYLPGWLWRLVAPLPIRFTVFLSVGLMPPTVRKKMGYAWTGADERRFRRTAAVIRRLWPLLPERLRYSPYARRGFARDGRPAA